MTFDQPLKLRTATPNDVAAIVALVHAAYAKWVPVVGREPRPMQADYDQAVLKHRIDLLLAGEHMVGLIETLQEDDHLWIENIAVSPDAQGRGYGRYLLAHAEELATAAGRYEVRLLTNAAFAANVALYHRTGYATLRSEPFMGGTTLYMGKVLPLVSRG